MGLSDCFIDPKTLPQDAYGFIQLTFLLFVYGYVLMVGSDMISDGSELLLLVPSVAGIVGSCVLPVLGAVPDGAIVLFSGLGSDAQYQLSVGVGALAGSTIMVLTIPWAMSIFGGRVDIENGNCVYKRVGSSRGFQKLTQPGLGLFTTGVQLTHLVRWGAAFMMITAIPYLLIQGSAFFANGTDSQVALAEKTWALVGLIFALILFFGYLGYQFHLADQGSNESHELKVDEIRKQKILEKQVSLMGTMLGELREHVNSHKGQYDAVQQIQIPPKLEHRLKSILRPFFDRYDADASGFIDREEFGAILKDLGENLSKSEKDSFFDSIDKDQSGSIDFNEFVQGISQLILKNWKRYDYSYSKTNQFQGKSMKIQETPVEDDEEKEEIPEEFANLSPAEQQYRIKLRSAYLMGLGTLVVLLFSDAMVDVLSEVGERTGINNFYISFVFAPLASNASEFIAAYNYSLKKTSKTITISLTTLQGAACMNNTFCLGVFLALIYFRSLAWKFSAETISILFVQICIACFSLKPVQRVFDALLILILYPVSLFVVAGLEAIGLD